MGDVLLDVNRGKKLEFNRNRYNDFKRYFEKRLNKDQLPAIYLLTSSALAGAITSTVTNPIWLIKTRLQLQGGGISQSKVPYRGMIGL